MCEARAKGILGWCLNLRKYLANAFMSGAVVD